jgi:thioredoxin-like negative regulator of GroEL
MLSLSSKNWLNYSLGVILSLGILSVAPVTSAQSTTDNVNSSPEENTVTPINQTESLLSLQGGQKLMQEAEKAITAENYDLASTKLQQARRIFNQLSNFYLQLAESFSGIDNRLAEGQRSGALKTATLRDESTYQLALVHRAQNKPELAVPLLIQIIKSQNPTSELGRKSYQQLYEIGFVESPFETTTTNNENTNNEKTNNENK